MAHHGDDRGTWLQVVGLVGVAAQADLDIGFGDPAQPVTEFGDDQLGGVGIDHLVDRRHDPHAHQRLDHIGGALGHAVGQLLDRDRLGNDDLTHDLGRLLVQHPQPFALAGPAHRGERAHPLAGFVVECPGDGELAGAAALVAPHRRGRPLQFGAAAGAQRGGGLVFLLGRDGDLAGGGESGHFGRRRLAGAFGNLTPRLLLAAARLLFHGALLRVFVGAFAGFLLLATLAQIFFGALARFYLGALLLLAAAVGLDDQGVAARDLVGLAGILERAHPRRVFFGRQGARYPEPPRRLGRFRSGGRGRLRPGDGRLGLGAARFDRGAGHRRPFLAHLDRDGLRASVREALPHLSGLDWSAQAEGAAGA